MEQKQPQLVEAVVSISGDYCIWHEVSIRCEHVFGSGCPGFLYEVVSDHLELSEEEIEAMDAETIDKTVKDFIEKYASAYTDYAFATVLKYEDSYYMAL